MITEKFKYVNWKNWIKENNYIYKVIIQYLVDKPLVLYKPSIKISLKKSFLNCNQITFNFKLFKLIKNLRMYSIYCFLFLNEYENFKDANTWIGSLMSKRIVWRYFKLQKMECIWNLLNRHQKTFNNMIYKFWSQVDNNSYRKKLTVSTVNKNKSLRFNISFQPHPSSACLPLPGETSSSWTLPHSPPAPHPHLAAPFPSDDLSADRLSAAS